MQPMRGAGLQVCIPAASNFQRQIVGPNLSPQPGLSPIITTFREHDGYDERLQAVEECLRSLVQQKDVSPTGNPRTDQQFQRTPRSTEACQQVASDEELATLNEDDALEQDAGEDSVDGMASITDPEQLGSRFFGTCVTQMPRAIPKRITGPSSNIAFLRHTSEATSAALRAIGPSRQSDNVITQSLVSRAGSPAVTMSETSPISRYAVTTRSLPSEARAVSLIMLFFSDTGMLFPYVHEGEILRSYAAAKENHFVSVSRSWLCLLNVIFAFATYISAHPEQPAEKNAADSEIFIERAQALSSEIELRTASIETGGQSYIPSFSELTDSLSSSVPVINDPISSRNAKIGANMESSWTCSPCRYSTGPTLEICLRRSKSVGVGDPKADMVRLRGA